MDKYELYKEYYLIDKNFSEEEINSIKNLLDLMCIEYSLEGEFINKKDNDQKVLVIKAKNERAIYISQLKGKVSQLFIQKLEKLYQEKIFDCIQNNVITRTSTKKLALFYTLTYDEKILKKYNLHGLYSHKDKWEISVHFESITDYVNS
jgi:hypothetical protein